MERKSVAARGGGLANGGPKLAGVSPDLLWSSCLSLLSAGLVSVN
jgi:hypothetical protein